MQNQEPQKPVCPAGLEVRITDFAIEEGLTMPVCGKYERESKLTGFLPSIDYCPNCKYNPENVKRSK